MSNAADATMAFLNSLNAVTNSARDYNQNEAKRSTQNKQIQLKKDIQNKMMEIQRSSSSDEWQTKIDGYFQSVKSSMSDKNSPYYCKNNLQAEMFDSILQEAQVSVSGEVQQLVFKADRNHALVEYQNSLETLAQTETPENYLRLANEGARNLRECGYIDEDQLQQQYNNNFDRCYINTATKLFDNTVEEAIKRGDSEQTVIDMVFKKMPELIASDSAGLPKMRDTTQLKETLTKTMRQDYKAKQQDIWDQTEKKCAQIYDSIMDQTTAEGRNLKRMDGRMLLDSVKNTGLISADQLTKWTARFALEDYYSPESTTTSSQRKSAANKMDPDDYMDFYFNAIENGDASTVYNAWKDCEDDMLEEFRRITGDASADVVDLEKAYPKVGAFLKKAREHLPPDLKDVVSFAENVIKSTTNTKDNPNKYKEEIESTLDLVYDIVFDTDIKNAGPEAKKELKTRIIRALNANLGGVLQKQKDYNEYFEGYEGIKTLSGYKEGVIQGKEARMAQAMVERDANPDLVYTKANGVEVPYAMQEGLARLENDERSELKALYKSQTGRELTDKEIGMHYESDGRNDVTARRRYTIDGWDYRFRTEDGKTIILEKKKNGQGSKNETNDTSNWEVVRTVSQQEKYNAPKAVAKRTEEEIKTIVNKTNWKKINIPDGGFKYTDENGKEQSLTYTDPEGEERPISQTYWKYLNANEKKRIIMEYMEKNPEAADKWLNSIKTK